MAVEATEVLSGGGVGGILSSRSSRSSSRSRSRRCSRSRRRSRGFRRSGSKRRRSWRRRSRSMCHLGMQHEAVRF